MGTSVNHPSPNIPAWRLAKAVLGNTQWPITRQSSEIWQAALSDRKGELNKELRDSLFAEACRIADSSPDPIVAVETFDYALQNTYRAGLIFEMGKRALARAVATRTGATGFASELFAETVAYYVARDLPSIIGTPGRVVSVSEGIRLKETIKDIARSAAAGVGRPSTDFDGWQKYVGSVLSALQGSQEQL